MAENELKDAIRLEGITKTFGKKVTANRNVSMSIRRGEILSLLGENGSGKTTLMNILSGIYYPDEGRIFVNGEEVTIASPKDAFDLGIGMIHQHFKLVDVFTAAENVVLGLPASENGGKRFDMKAVAEKIRGICARYGFDIVPEQKVYEMTVSQKQMLEIVKVLYRGADILILDEPTAVLTPQETQRLFQVLRSMREEGKAVIIITHKLHEVMEISDRVAVLRRGEYIGDVKTADTNPQKLTEMMVGRPITLNIDRPAPRTTELRLAVRGLTVKNEEEVTMLDHVSFDVYSGEILGIAGVSGSGQKELLESIAGLQRTEPGSSIRYYAQGEPEELIGKDTLEIRRLGVALSFVPEDRLGMGLVGSMGMTDNMMLRDYKAGHSIFANRRQPRRLAETIKENLEVVAPDVATPVSRLSGGNVQKVLVGREIAVAPSVLMTAYAVRGLDINTSYTIYHLLNEQKEKGVAVIYVGEDLDVLLQLCDRILVLCAGKVNGVVDGRHTSKEEVGLMMTHLKEKEGA